MSNPVSDNEVGRFESQLQVFPYKMHKERKMKLDANKIFYFRNLFEAAVLFKVAVAHVVALVLPGEVNVLLAVSVRPPGEVDGVVPKRGERAVVVKGLDAELGQLDERFELRGRHRLVGLPVDVDHIFLVTAYKYLEQNSLLQNIPGSGQRSTVVSVLASWRTSVTPPTVVKLHKTYYIGFYFFICGNIFDLT